MTTITKITYRTRAGDSGVVHRLEQDPFTAVARFCLERGIEMGDLTSVTAVRAPLPASLKEQAGFITTQLSAKEMDADEFNVLPAILRAIQR